MKALIVYGGWAGHEPDKVAAVLQKAGTGRTVDMLDDLAGDLVAEVVGTVRAVCRSQQTTQADVLSAMSPGAQA